MSGITGFMRHDALAGVLNTAVPRLAIKAFTHQREHNIYFRNVITGLLPNQPALLTRKTKNNTLCSDHLIGSALELAFTYQKFINFLTVVIEITILNPIICMLVHCNVLGYGDGETLNWYLIAYKRRTNWVLWSYSLVRIFSTNFKSCLNHINPDDSHNLSPSRDTAPTTLAHMKCSGHINSTSKKEHLRADRAYIFYRAFRG